MSLGEALILLTSEEPTKTKTTHRQAGASVFEIILQDAVVLTLERRVEGRAPLSGPEISAASVNKY